MRLALFQPDIPQNLGGAIRLAACLGLPLEVIEPCGFPLSDRSLKRAALDYGPEARVTRHDSWRAFRTATGGARLVLFTTRAATRIDSFAFTDNDILLFGRESAGVPEEVHQAAEARVFIPIRPETRSLNLVTAAAVGAWEAMRQLGVLPGDGAVET